MWVLIVASLAYGTPAGVQHQWDVDFQEFTSEQRCQDAAKAIEAILDNDLAKRRQAVSDMLAAGEIRGPNAIVSDVRCVPK